MSGRALAALAVAVAAGGCGQADDRAAVRAVTERFLAAHVADQGEEACAALSDDTRRQLEREEGVDCPRAVAALELDGGRVVRAQVYVTNAKVDLSSGESAFLSEERAGWRLSAVGCRPQGGKPADRPFTCELEA